MPDTTQIALIILFTLAACEAPPTDPDAPVGPIIVLGGELAEPETFPVPREEAVTTQDAAARPENDGERRSQQVAVPARVVLEPALCADYELRVLDSATVAPGQVVDLVTVTAGDRPIVLDFTGLTLAASAPFELEAVAGVVELEAGESMTIATAALPATWRADDILPTVAVRLLGQVATLTPTPWAFEADSSYRGLCD